MNIEECLEKELLKKDVPSLEKANRSIERAKGKLETAREEYDAGIFESAVIVAYTSMFHAARALLFRDGYREKSHYGLFVYIKEKYSDKLESRFISELNSLRLERHDLLYGLEEYEVGQAESENVIEVAEDFIKAVEKLLEPD